MRTLGIITLCIVVLIVGVIIWYISAHPTYTYRYRMTVDVEVNGTLRSGSSVIEVQLIKQSQFLVPMPPVQAKARGEAIFVDLGEGRNVIALLASGPNASKVDYPKYVVSTHFKLSTVKPEDLEKYSKLEGHRDLQDDRLPTFVTFSDLNDPKTARVVGAGEFEQVFGKDVRFKRVWIEMTDDPVTSGIDKKLLWWGKPLPWIKPTGPNTGVDTRPFVPGEYRLMSEQFRRGS